MLRNGVRLAGLDFGGEGSPVLLLHGLAGYAGEWAETAAWLTDRSRVVAFDARGHGGSERLPADVSRAAHTADALMVIERLGLAPAVVIGQSLGAQVAILLAAEHPELMRGLVVVDASPDCGKDAETIEANVTGLGRSLRRWPVPFASLRAAQAFFGGPSLRAEAWARGLEHRDGCWWPRFDVDVMVRTLRAAAEEPVWDAWSRAACPALVVRAGHGELTEADSREMSNRGRHTSVVEVTAAGHDVHLDCPAEWRRVLSQFLDSLSA